MSRFSRKVINSSENAWDGDVNDNLLYVFDRPYPPYSHGNTMANLESTFAAASHELSLALAEYESSGGDTLVMSDATAYRLLSNWKWMRKRITSHSSGPQSLSDNDDVVVFTGGSSFAYNLTASSATQKGRRVYLKHRGTGTITITPNLSDTVDGAASLALSTQNDAVVICDDGAGDWLILAGHP